jgi:hypothetical protein
MLKSLMVGITEKDMQAVVNTYDLPPCYNQQIHYN